MNKEIFEITVESARKMTLDQLVAALDALETEIKARTEKMAELKKAAVERIKATN